MTGRYSKQPRIRLRQVHRCLLFLFCFVHSGDRKAETCFFSGAFSFPRSLSFTCSLTLYHMSKFHLTISMIFRGAVFRQRLQFQHVQISNGRNREEVKPRWSLTRLYKTLC
jgi:hypothetical protein